MQSSAACNNTNTIQYRTNYHNARNSSFLAKLLALTSSYWLQIENYFIKCLIFDIVYILSYPSVSELILNGTISTW